ncbi:MAG: ATP-dependent helicase [Chloroflexi bacterium]|jgi:DNA helicase-2/ATP-dependent DNA helicase PcrA|nr:ATP-dependent helicase [Chloroflexota bacterium]
MAADYSLRPSQKKVLEYQKGLMGISAVPGSGKTFTLSHLAVKLILSASMEPEQEILVVTFSNSAADNFSTRIGEKLHASGLLEGFGYRVRTLHGLANDIIRERPELVGLSRDFNIIDEAETNDILKDLVAVAMEAHYDYLFNLISEDFNEKKQADIYRKEMPGLLQNLATNWIKTVKDEQISLVQLQDWLSDSHSNPLLNICLEIYKGYQAALNYRGAIDFDDLIRYANECLDSDVNLCNQLQRRWLYVLEDEAQDSSKLQQSILEKIVGKNGNWVRVGDPNQAIYESFTTADPNLLKQFIAREHVRSIDLPVSGRSARSIINLANSMIEWVESEHPNFSVRDALSQPFIQPTSPHDPQANPPSLPGNIEIAAEAMTAEQELIFITKRVKEWLELNPESTIAVLTFVNKRASEIINHLKAHKVPVSDALMKVPEETRNSAGAISLILKSVLDPTHAGHLGTSFEVFYRHLTESDHDPVRKGFTTSDPGAKEVIKATSSLIKALKFTEVYLYPPDYEWKQAFNGEELSDTQLELLHTYRQAVVRWHRAAILPLDQLILVIAQDLVLQSSEIALIHKLSGLINTLSQNNPHWSVLDLLQQLIDISKNDRAFGTFSPKNDGFNPELYKGQVVIATMHKSKGLEWDKVFLTSANNYDYPSGDAGDVYTGEKWFIEGKRNLEAELLYDLDALKTEKNGGMMLRQYDKQTARDDIVRDRLRLFYVGLTRARKSLTISWNTGRMKNLKAALPVQILNKRMIGDERST